MSACFFLLGLTYHWLCVASLGHDFFCGCPTQMSTNASGSGFLNILMLSVVLGGPEKWTWRAYTSVWRKKFLIATAHISLDIAFEVLLILTGTWNLSSFCLAPLRCTHLQFYLTIHLCNCNETRNFCISERTVAHLSIRQPEFCLRPVLIMLRFANSLF